MRMRDIISVCEGNESDGFIIRLTDTVLRVFAERVPSHLTQNVRRYRKYYNGEALRNPEFLGRVTIGEIAEQEPARSPREQRFFERQADLSIGFRFEQQGYAAAYFHNQPFQKANTINVRLPDAAMDILVTPILNRKKLRPPTVLAALAVRRSELVHELRHAYDDAVSGGKFLQNKRSQAASAAARQGDREATALYFNDPIEISARLTAVLGHHANAVRGAFPDFATLVMHDFGRWSDVPVDERRKLLKRIASFYIHQRNVDQTRA